MDFLKVDSVGTALYTDRDDDEDEKCEQLSERRVKEPAHSTNSKQFQSQRFSLECVTVRLN